MMNKNPRKDEDGLPEVMRFLFCVKTLLYTMRSPGQTCIGGITTMELLLFRGANIPSPDPVDLRRTKGTFSTRSVNQLLSLGDFSRIY
jgi:hypothetical protein